MSNLFSCRVGVYGSAEKAFPLLPAAGIHGAEIGVSEDLDFGPVKELADRHGLAIATVATGLALDPIQELEDFSPLLQAVARIGTRKIFVSVKGSDTLERKELIRRLRIVADRAHALGMTLCMETHPPFGTNGDVARATIEEVASPGLGFNFDTANIYYYNRGTDSVTELRKVASFVTSVHLKDTDGGFESPNFPVLGEGVVDFPAVFEILSKVSFTGPYTLEIEGPLTSGKSTAEIHKVVMDCMKYLKRIGAA